MIFLRPIRLLLACSRACRYCIIWLANRPASRHVGQLPVGQPVGQLTVGQCHAMLARSPSWPTRGPTGSWPTAPTTPSWPTLAQLTVGQLQAMLARPPSCSTRGPTTVGQQTGAVGSRAQLDNLQPTAVGVVVAQPRPVANGSEQLHNYTPKSRDGWWDSLPLEAYAVYLLAVWSLMAK